MEVAGKEPDRKAGPHPEGVTQNLSDTLIRLALWPSQKIDLGAQQSSQLRAFLDRYGMSAALEARDGLGVFKKARKRGRPMPCFVIMGVFISGCNRKEEMFGSCFQVVPANGRNVR